MVEQLVQYAQKQAQDLDELRGGKTPAELSASDLQNEVEGLRSLNFNLEQRVKSEQQLLTDKIKAIQLDKETQVAELRTQKEELTNTLIEKDEEASELHSKHAKLLDSIAKIKKEVVRKDQELSQAHVDQSSSIEEMIKSNPNILKKLKTLIGGSHQGVEDIADQAPSRFMDVKKLKVRA